MQTIPNPGTYDHLNALSPEAFLNPDNFVTGWDARHTTLHDEQYKKGLEIGRKSRRVFISCNSTWGADGENSYTTSHEGIGYHACTADLLRGFLDSGVELAIYRYSTGYDHPTIIRPAVKSA